ncbi:hypothetical protein C9374_012892 [Naegleria lovaniensis]|uniref:Calpain catalytic domain-containing protein n=1 Tax=Naegleria lovaniensis TaxID=51637 RepID=A0AA88GAL6_NAELO|nr:uncharacterized protein C9374_012892 [Naegleria lovaniensis]KAG2373046.1 hypothetical protein C9374_012892 [Naegleria lovaniensis]
MGNKATKTLGEEPNADLDFLASNSYREDLFEIFPVVIEKLESGVGELEQFEKLLEDIGVHYKTLIKKFTTLRKKEASSSDTRKPTEVLDKLYTGLETMAQNYVNTCNELETLAKDVDEVKKELEKYISMAKKEEKQLSSRLVSARKDEDKIRDKYFDEKQYIQETRASTLVTEVTEKKVQDLLKKIAQSEETVSKLEKDADVAKRKVKEVSSEYDTKLKNILSHLEFIDRKRFRYMKEMISRFNTIQVNTAKMVIEQSGIIDNKVSQLNEESEFSEFIKSTKAANLNENKSSISQESEYKRMQRLAAQSYEYLKFISEGVRKNIELTNRFSDQQFPPLNASIDPTIEHQIVLWARAPDILGNNFKVFSPETILSNDIHSTNMINDAWLCSALCVLGAKPALIERLFAVKQVNEAGIYEMNLCIAGEWCKIVIDDYFPLGKDGKPLYASSKMGDMWMMAIEKAVAKVFGYYNKLSSGFTISDAFELLSGCPTFSINVKHEPSENLWRRVTQFGELRYITACTTSDFTALAQQKIDPQGLSPHQTYVLLGCVDISGKKVLKLKALRGKSEWKGAWSVTDKVNWTPEFRNALSVESAANEGCFFISLTDFMKYFSTISACKYDPLFSRYFIRSPTNDASVFDLIIDNDQKEMYIGLHQLHENIRGFSGKSPIGFIITNKKQKVIYAIPINTHHYNFTEPLSLRAGEYQIIPVIPTDIAGLNRAAYYVVTVHARGNIKLKLADTTKTKLPLSAMKVLVDSYRMKMQQQHQAVLQQQQQKQQAAVVGTLTSQQLPPDQVLLPFQRQQSSQFKPLQEAADDEVDIQYVVQSQEKTNSPPDMAAVPSSSSTSTTTASVDENSTSKQVVATSENSSTNTPISQQEATTTSVESAQNETSIPPAQEPSNTPNETLHSEGTVVHDNNSTPTDQQSTCAVPAETTDHDTEQHE